MVNDVSDLPCFLFWLAMVFLQNFGDLQHTLQNHVPVWSFPSLETRSTLHVLQSGTKKCCIYRPAQTVVHECVLEDMVKLICFENRWSWTSPPKLSNSNQMQRATKIQDVAHHALDIMLGKVDIDLFIIHGGSFCSLMGRLFSTCGFWMASWILMARRYVFQVRTRRCWN